MKKNKSNISMRDEFIRLDDDSSFTFVEAYKTLRTNLSFSLAQREYKRLLVTSSLPSEGKSTTSVSLGTVFAQTGAKVLLIDADMRNPKLHRYFRQKNDIGLSSVLSNALDVDKVIYATKTENLYLIKSGPIPPNPAELLDGKFMDPMLQKLEELFDYIIFDTPPLNVVTDSLCIAQHKTSVLFVVSEKNSTHEEFKKSLRAIDMANADLIGVVLNNSKEEKNSKYYKKYGYSYGERPSARDSLTQRQIRRDSE